MLAGEIFLVVFTLANMCWSFLNWRTRANSRNEQFQLLDEAIQFRQQAMEYLKKARHASDVEANEFKVCSECELIKSRWMTSESGKIVCIECAANFAAKG